MKDNSIDVTDTVDVVNDTNSSNFILTVELGELIMLSDHPAADAGRQDEDTSESTMLEDDEVEEDLDDDILVDLCEEETCNPIIPDDDGDYDV